GHETDTTIIDFVADLRAPTPSAAAELAVYDISLLESELAAIENSLHRLLKNRLDLIKYQMLFFRNRLDNLSPLVQIREKRTFAVSLENRIQILIDDKLKNYRHQLLLMTERLKGLSPHEKLDKGYAFVEDSEGVPIADIAQVECGDSIKVSLKNGRFLAKISEKDGGLR
ncbi:MAG: exodeoxyribonuclease VII large subunit, partial [Lachnospiraceae bacterium]|nr:exodeoxyribonuclease VII large subunit [Lachnospiraceae bacterium]